MHKPSFSSEFCTNIERLGMLFGAFVRSPINEGKIKSVKLKHGNCLIFDSEDLPAKKTAEILGVETPLLSCGEISCKNEIVALVLGKNEEAVFEAAKNACVELDGNDFFGRIQKKWKDMPQKSISLFILKNSPQKKISLQFKNLDYEKEDFSSEISEFLKIDSLLNQKKEKYAILAKCSKKIGKKIAFNGSETRISGVWSNECKKNEKNERLSCFAECEENKIRIFSPSLWLSALSKCAAQACGVDEDKIEITHTAVSKNGGSTSAIWHGILISVLAAAVAKKTKRSVRISLSKEEMKRFEEENAKIQTKATALVELDGKIRALSFRTKVFSGIQNPFAQEIAERLCLPFFAFYDAEFAKSTVSVLSSSEFSKNVDLQTIAQHSFFAIENLLDQISLKMGFSPKELRAKNLKDSAFLKKSRSENLLEKVCNALDDFVRAQDLSATKNDVFRAKKTKISGFSPSEFERKFSSFRFASKTRSAKETISPENQNPRGIALSLAAEGHGRKSREIGLECELRDDGKFVIRSLPVSDSVWQNWTEICARVLGKRADEIFLSPPSEESRWPDSLSVNETVKNHLLLELLNKIKSGEKKASATMEISGDSPFFAFSLGACTAEVEIEPCDFSISLKKIRIALDNGKSSDKNAIIKEAKREVQAILPSLVVDSTPLCPEISVDVLESDGIQTASGKIIQSLLPAAFSSAVSQALNRKIEKLPVSRNDIFKAIYS